MDTTLRAGWMDGGREGWMDGCNEKARKEERNEGINFDGNLRVGT